MASIQLYALLWFFFPPSTLYHFLYSISLPHVLTRHSSCFSDVLPRVLISFVTPYEPSYIHLFYAHFLSQSPSLFPVLRSLQQVVLHCFLPLFAFALRTFFLPYSMLILFEPSVC